MEGNEECKQKNARQKVQKSKGSTKEKNLLCGSACQGDGKKGE